MTANRIDQLVADWSPQLRKAFLDGVYALRNRAQVARIIERLERGDIEAAIRAVGLDPLAFRELDQIIAKAYDAGGRYTEPQVPPGHEPDGFRIIVQWDVRNPRAEDWLRNHSAGLIRDIMEDQRVAVRQFLVSGMEQGLNPRTVALDLVGRLNKATGQREGGTIGLTASQEQWVRDYAAELGNLDSAVLSRALRDRRFDRTVRQAINSETPLPAETLGKMVTAYRNRALIYRAETIGRTESLTALHASQLEMYEQAIEQGVVERDKLRRIWMTARDARVRDTHAEMDGQAVKWTEDFLSPSGATLRYPGDPAAPPAERIGCRCFEDVRVLE